MTQLKVYQIGAMTLALKTPDLIDSPSYGGNLEGVRPFSAIEDIARDMQFRGQKNRDVKISMYLSDMANYKADGLYQYLLSIIGKPVPIIAYIVHDNLYQTLGDCCTCLPQNNCCLTFLMATGVITRVPELKQRDWANPPEMNLTIEIYTYWQPLNRMFWKWQESNSFLTIQPQTPNLEMVESWSLPTCESLFRRCLVCGRGFVPIQYTSYDFIYDPDFMELMLCVDECNCGGDCCTGKEGVLFRDSTSGIKNYLNMKSEYYNAPPMPRYVINGINDDTDIVINTTGTDSGLSYQRIESRILISRTNEILIANGYSALNTNDKIIVGDFTFNVNNAPIRNALIIKNGIVLSNVQPVVSSESSYCGYIIPANDASFAIYGNFNSYHALFQFRRN